jgi:titin
MKMCKTFLVSSICNLYFVVVAKPSAPGTPDIIKTDKTSADLKWTPPTEDGGAPITNYVIEYRPSGAVHWVRANKSPVTDTTYSVADLREGSEYEFRVSAENKAGVGPASEHTKSVKVEKPIGKVQGFNSKTRRISYVLRFVVVQALFY